MKKIINAVENVIDGVKGVAAIPQATALRFQQRKLAVRRMEKCMKTCSFLSVLAAVVSVAAAVVAVTSMCKKDKHSSDFCEYDFDEDTDDFDIDPICDDDDCCSCDCDCCCDEEDVFFCEDDDCDSEDCDCDDKKTAEVKDEKEDKK